MRTRDRIRLARLANALLVLRCAWFLHDRVPGSGQAAGQGPSDTSPQSQQTWHECQQNT
jgi:hypothetical protein